MNIVKELWHSKTINDKDKLSNRFYAQWKKRKSDRFQVSRTFHSVWITIRLLICSLSSSNRCRHWRHHFNLNENEIIWREFVFKWGRVRKIIAYRFHLWWWWWWWNVIMINKEIYVNYVFVFVRWSECSFRSVKNKHFECLLNVFILNIFSYWLIRMVHSD